MFLANFHLSKSNKADTSAIVMLLSWYCIVQVKGKNSHLKIFVLGFLKEYSANIHIPALLALNNDSLLTGICFLLLVVPDDAENCKILSGRTMFSFSLASSI
ncbi:MAG: hypothetical protein BWY04_01206 [candidate division CPR1 bacterium ADurb.Bin160]|uniref:Uncharacterized protein n=1 Tax=candidate division CPR1 bacterium ADurb.Bin160 TaxID=1852826 RepID=A0A1V5ZKN9_9BACT|nr:MAG: hypothetical protein BWY04_01206 [candidate division CPR1 bacterium ADurb.Bin160]